MNDDEKKPVVGEAKADEPEKKPEQDDTTKVAVKFEEETDTKASIIDNEEEKDNIASESDSEELNKADAIDITAALNGDDTVEDEPAHDEEPEEEVSEEERELGRIEGLESAETVGRDTKENVATDERDEVEAMVAPVDLEKEILQPEEDAKNPLVEALRKQEQSKSEPKKSKAGLLAGLLGLFLVVAVAGAVYFYMQVASTNDQLAAAQAELATAQSKNSTLAADLQKAKSATVVNTAQYKAIDELGVRYKVTDTNKVLLYGYAGSKDTKTASVGFTTVDLSNISEPKNGVDDYPCALGGTTQGMITRYSDGSTLVAGSPVSKMGKKIGDAYYVYTPAQAACSTQKTDEQAKAKAAVKQVYDSLEAIPASTTTSVSAEVSPTTTKQ